MRALDGGVEVRQWRGEFLHLIGQQTRQGGIRQARSGRLAAHAYVRRPPPARGTTGPGLMRRSPKAILPTVNLSYALLMTFLCPFAVSDYRFYID